MSGDSRQIGVRIEFDGCEEATFDPSSISNGCWDHKLARVATWCCGGVSSKLETRNTDEKEHIQHIIYVQNSSLAAMGHTNYPQNTSYFLRRTRAPQKKALLPAFGTMERHDFRNDRGSPALLIRR